MAAVDVGPSPPDEIRVLSLHNYAGWAIHNVGKLWLEHTPQLRVTFGESDNFARRDFGHYDLVWFGYLDLFLNHYLNGYFSAADLDKCVVSLHDPLELFPQQEDWKQIDLDLRRWWKKSSWYRWMRLRLLQQVRHVVTTSKEMQSVLKDNAVAASLLPTTSSLPPRRPDEVKTEKCAMLSVFETYPRKNVPLMESLQRHCRDSLGLRFDTKVGRALLPGDGYLNLMDDHEIYVCTSYQEGGPIPAMDAMQRGAIVLSTPVGQIQDIIRPGENGYICRTHEEFTEKIELLAGDLALLQSMRLKSLQTIRDDRDAGEIKVAACSLVTGVVGSASSPGHGSAELRNRAKWVVLSNFYKLCSTPVLPLVRSAAARGSGLAVRVVSRRPRSVDADGR
jgi:hypothetical protein